MKIKTEQPARHRFKRTSTITPAERAKNKEKAMKKRATLAQYGVETMVLDGDRSTSFLSAEEQAQYDRDCFSLILFLNAEKEPPEDLKARLLEIKARKERVVQA